MIARKFCYLPAVVACMASMVIGIKAEKTPEPKRGSNHDAVAEQADGMYAIVMRFKADSKMDWKVFKESAERLKFNWKDLVAYSKLDQEMVFIIRKTNVIDERGELPSTGLFILACQNYGYATADLEGVSKIEPLQSPPRNNLPSKQ